MISKSAYIRPLTSELPALERRKKCCGHDSAYSFDQIFFKLVGKKEMHKIMDEVYFGPDRTMEKMLWTQQRTHF